MEILMPKATATWLVENTALTFVQIGAFVGMHDLEVRVLADADKEHQLQGANPILTGLLTQEEIDRVAADPAARLEVAAGYEVPPIEVKGARRYTPIMKRANKPNAIAWLVREYPEMTDSQIGKLVGSTKPTIKAIRDRTHWNMVNIEPGSPVELGLCSMNEMQVQVDRIFAKRAQNESAADEGDSGSSDKQTPDQMFSDI